MNKYHYSERDICTKFITPAIVQVGWQHYQFCKEMPLTYGRVMVRDKLTTCIKNPDVKVDPKRADFVLYARPNMPISVVETNQACFSVGHGMQQVLSYAEMLDAHVAFGQKTLTPHECANNVKMRDVFGKYGEQARAVLEALLDKFADHGVQDIEDTKVLELTPCDQSGCKTQIRRGIFGSVEQYTQAGYGTSALQTEASLIPYQAT